MNYLRRLLSHLRVPVFVFGKSKLLLAFEYGVILSQVAKEQGVEITPEFIKDAEEMILGEFPRTRATRLATEIVPNILTVFKLDIRK
jgi:hypothetical protein